MKSLLAIVALLVVAACAAEAPQVTLAAPAEAILEGDSVTLRFVASGVAIVAATGTAVAGEGHHHLFVDRDPTPDGTAIPKGDGILHLGSGADSARLALPVGTHRLIAVLASGDHVPVAGAGRDTIEVTVIPRP